MKQSGNTKAIYDGFISHSSPESTTEEVRKGLHRLARPWYKTRALNVYLDKTNLAANTGLGAELERALASSRYLILLASPSAAVSEWVDRESSWWVQNRGVGQIIIVAIGSVSWDTGNMDLLTAEGKSVLPPSLRGIFEAEPLFVDFSWLNTSDKLSLEHAQFRHSIVSIAAPLHGIPREELDGDDVQQRKRTRAISSVAVMAIIVFAVVAFFQWQLALDEGQRANLKAKEALAVSLTLRARLAREDGSRLEESMLYAVEAYKRVPSGEAVSEMDTGLNLLPDRVSAMNHSDAIAEVLSNEDESMVLVIGACSNKLHIRDLESGEIANSFESKGVIRSFSATPDLQNIIVVTSQTPFSGECFSNGVPLGTTAGDEIVLWRPGSVDGESAVIDSLKSSHPKVVIDPQGRFATMASSRRIAIYDLLNSVSDNNLLTTLLVPESVTNNLIFSPNGDYLVATAGQSISMWSTINWKVVWQRNIEQLTQGVQNSVADVAISPDGTLLAVTSDPALHLIEIKTGTNVLEPILHRGAQTVSFGPQGRWLTTVSRFDRIRLFDTHDWRSTRIPHNEAAQTAFDRKGEFLVTTGAGVARVWELINLEQTAVAPHNGITAGVAVQSPILLSSRDWLITSVGSDLFVWHNRAESEVTSISGNYYNARFTDKNEVVVWGGRDYAVWNGIPWKKAVGGQRGLFRMESDTMASVENDVVTVRRISDGTELSQISHRDLTPMQTNAGRESDSNRIQIRAMSVNSALLATTRGTKLYLWDVVTGTVLFTHDFLEQVRSVRLSDGGVMAVVTQTGNHYFDTVTQKLLDQKTSDGKIERLSPRGDYVTTIERAEIFLSNTRNGKTLWKMDHYQHKQIGEFSGNEKYYFEVDDNTIKMWNVEQRSIEHKFVQTGRIQDWLLSTDQSVLVAVNEKNQITIWSIPTRAVLATRSWDFRIGKIRLNGENDLLLITTIRVVPYEESIRVTEAEVLPPRKQELMRRGTSRGGRQKYTDVWNWRENRFIASYPGTGQDVSLDKSLLITTEENAAVLWNLDGKVLADEVCNRVTRNLTPVQWRRSFNDEPYRRTCDANR